MPDPQEPRTGGVAVWRNPRPVEHGASESTHYYTDAPAYLVGDREPGTWFPLAEAEALAAVEVAASVGRRDGWGAQAQYDMARALSVLHNLRNAALRSKGGTDA